MKDFKAKNSISAGPAPHTPVGELTPSCIWGPLRGMGRVVGEEEGKGGRGCRGEWTGGKWRPQSYC